MAATMTAEQIETKISEARARVEADIAEANSLLEAPGDGIVDDDAQAKFREVMGRARSHRDTLESLIEHKALTEWAAEPAQPSAAQTQADAGQVSQPASIGSAFTKSKPFRDMLEQGAYKMDRPFDFKSWHAAVETKDVYSTQATSALAARLGSIQRDPVVERAKRTARVRDLFPVVATTSAVVEYFKVTGFTSSASVVADYGGGAFTSKPHSALTIDGAQATVRLIAHWEAAHRSALADEPALQSVIENELRYGLLLEEDNQILNGNGSGENLTGILNASGIQTQSLSTNGADTVRKAMTKVMLAYYEPTGIIMHPNDWEQIVLLKSAGSEAFYLFANAASQTGNALQGGTVPQLWGLPVIATPAITEGTALVGAFGLGASLYDREQATIRISEEHSDYFIRNAVVLLAEERLALAVKRPESFCKCTGI